MMGLPGSRGPMGSKVSVWSTWTFPGLFTKVLEQLPSTKMGTRWGCYPGLENVTGIAGPGTRVLTFTRPLGDIMPWDAGTY